MSIADLMLKRALSLSYMIKWDVFIPFRLTNPIFINVEVLIDCVYIMNPDFVYLFLGAALKRSRSPVVGTRHNS